LYEQKQVDSATHVALETLLFLEYFNSEKFHKLQKIFLFFYHSNFATQKSEAEHPQGTIPNGFLLSERDKSLTAAYKAD
jgi:hypothetical protein